MVIGLPGRVGVAHPATACSAFPVGLHGIADLVLLFRIQEDIDQWENPEDIVRPRPTMTQGPCSAILRMVWAWAKIAWS